MNIGTNQFLTGANGYVWFDGELLANLKKIDIKVEADFDDVVVAGDHATYPQYKGYAVSGSMTMVKKNSRIVAKYAAAYKSGVMPPLKIISKLTDVNTGESERAAITGAVITTLSIMGFEDKNTVEVEYPIKASGFEILEEIS